ncbi:uncharacterized protein LOC111117226 [Crassostrea virginica]
METRTLIRLLTLGVFISLCIIAFCPAEVEGTYLIRRRTQIRRKHYGTRIRLGFKRKYNSRRKRRFRPRPIIVHSRPQTTIHYHYYIRPSYLPPVLPRGCGGRCGRHAFCWRGHTCLCRKGYKGNPLRRCYPGGGPCGNRCGKNAVCVSGKCKCKNGHYGNPLVACFRECVCKGGCGINAACNKRTGKCQCKPKFIGNPRVRCISLYGCTGGCGPNALCKNGKFCSCKPGYGPNPVVGCKPVPGCVRKCGLNAYCDSPNRKCVCKSGYVGNAYQRCRLIYSLPCGGRCGVNAHCRKGVCVCKPSCHGNPYTNCVKDTKG